jgi:GT2 family glycosyltransferase/glycosyltransferase involved in cell wall biosynthesis
MVYYDKTTVSIIIPVFNQWDYTTKCLEAVKKNTAGIIYEVIIVDDCSTDEAPINLLSDPEVVYLRNTQNEGFIRVCNEGARHAKGDIYLFLNNDTEVQAGWLSAILDIFRNYNDAGIVGSMLLNSDGSLQEAGGIIWNDGSAWNYGRGKDPLDWQYNFVREVDYVSGASLAIKAEVWKQCKGFDERYMPAYCEDSDLCITVRELGYKVYYQPRSVVIHYEGITSGKSLVTGVKKYQIINTKKLYEKWQSVLDTKHWYPDPALAHRAKWHGQRAMALVVDVKVPEQDIDAGSVRMKNIVLLLVKKGFRVTLFSNSKPNRSYAQYFMDLGVEVVGQYQHFEEFIIERALQFDMVWLARPEVSFSKLDTVRKYMPSVKIVYDNVDLYFVRTLRQSAIEQNANMEMSANVYKAEELYLNRFADLSVVVTDDEKVVLSTLVGNIDPIVIPHILQMPSLQSVPFEERKGIMFLGGYKHTPNVDAVIWFVKEVFPLIRKTIRDIVLYVLGSSPPEEIMTLNRDGEVEVIGWVEDLDPWFSNSRVFVSPLRYGAGVKGKNVQAMSYGLPMVTTTIGAEGMNLTHNKNTLIADSPEDFAKAVIKLYQSPKLWREISANSVEHAFGGYSFTQVESKIEQLYKKLFGSYDIIDFIRPDVQKLCRMLEQKKSIVKLRRERILHLLRGIANRPVYIWGAGLIGIRTLALLYEVGCYVEGFIDSDTAKHGDSIESVTVFSSDILESDLEIKPFVVIGVGYSYRKEVEDRLKELRFEKDQDFILYHTIMGLM